MRTRHATVAGALALASMLLAAFAPPTAAQAPERRIAYRLPGMDAVARRESIPYRSLAGSPDTLAYGRALEYDVYLPRAPQGTRTPGVVFVHGGIVAGSRGERPKDWPAYQEWGRLAAAAGLVAVTFTHRLTTDDNVDVAAEDVEALLRQLRARAGEYGLDPDRLCVAVFSAGGPLASAFLRDPRPYVRCL
ncbi:MAG TPA: alpha/beta hydrolase, partial [Gemmatimonadaceae bacterium]|nr:alpha/beta hydrolase [Gemmatimonadaceae bacterium]